MIIIMRKILRFIISCALFSCSINSLSQESNCDVYLTAINHIERSDMFKNWHIDTIFVNFDTVIHYRNEIQKNYVFRDMKRSLLWFCKAESSGDMKIIDEDSCCQYNLSFIENDTLKSKAKYYIENKFNHDCLVNSSKIALLENKDKYETKFFETTNNHVAFSSVPSILYIDNEFAFISLNFSVHDAIDRFTLLLKRDAYTETGWRVLRFAFGASK